ncbi:hypothetical protein SAMN05421856_101390 [Chryseobacterium taichungense]|uniref:Lipocalin-like domain-containing protein n=1 Tax=Chryseobacterium taichungense TaxID=295069 RepID=A0A1H7W129_9FLAO|nr:hypothetical protein [Chryseobacterium taichungense]SEM14755.1 hypothetical protein SAMN05421856_101390 [Chryseobacterium taichungense]
MKYLFTFFLLLFLNSDKKDDFDYNILIGSWSQDFFANTTSTGIFTFNKDSTATLEMKNGKTKALIGGMQGTYKIEKSNKIIKITMFGQEKSFDIEELNNDYIVLQNKKDLKQKMSFKRYKE